MTFIYVSSATQKLVRMVFSRASKAMRPKKVWRSRVSIPVPPACKAGALPFELHPRQSSVSLVQRYRFCTMEQKENCANRESNPALKLGKLQCYRYTIGARAKECGGAGFRSLCLPIANRPLYRVSYTPVLDSVRQKMKYKLWGSNPCPLRDWRLKPAP